MNKSFSYLNSCLLPVRTRARADYVAAALLASTNVDYGYGIVCLKIKTVFFKKWHVKIDTKNTKDVNARGNEEVRESKGERIDARARCERRVLASA